MVRLAIGLMIGWCTLSFNQAFASSPIFFYCEGAGAEYQIIFELDEDQKSLIQRLEEPDPIEQGKVARELETVLTEFEISKDFVNYRKNGYLFSINRSNGRVLRDNQDNPIRCTETETDYLTVKRAEVETAKTTTTEFWSPTTGYGDTKYSKLGMLATADEICAVLSHPFFDFSSDEYRALDTMSSDFDWPGINAAGLWISAQFKDKGIQLQRFGLMENIHQAANRNLAECLTVKEIESPGFYEKLTRHLLSNLGYRGVNCIEQQFRIEQFVDNKGEIIDRRVPLESESCIDFDYNSGSLNGWNSSTFTLMLIWQEAHSVLKTIFDKGESVLVARLAEIERRRVAEVAAEEARKAAAEANRLRAEQDWLDYQSREKTLMEQVYNFATTGFPEGTQRLRWIEEQPCVLTDGARRVDNRLLNMTAFRIQREYIGSTWYTTSSDMNVKFSTSENIPLDRLQNAWGLAFQQCPGRTSAF
ncbi:MAG: hypothetical protein HWE12_05400 [Oceanospirillaceae bacterium]|nr:hypothetical protein [Oceanospirillaceae bacterium]